jgi:hypothetical protein
VVSNSIESLAGDYLIIREHVSRSTVSYASAAGSGKGSEGDAITMADIIRHLQAIEDIVCPMHPVPDALDVLEVTVREQGQQQVALNLTLQQVKCQD